MCRVCGFFLAFLAKSPLIFFPCSFIGTSGNVFSFKSEHGGRCVTSLLSQRNNSYSGLSHIQTVDVHEVKLPNRLGPQLGSRIVLLQWYGVIAPFVTAAFFIWTPPADNQKVFLVLNGSKPVETSNEITT